MAIEDGKTFDDFYPSRWLKVADLPDKNAIYTISDVSAEQVGEDQKQKLVLKFKESTKDMILNKTNGSTLTDLYGANPNDWITKRISLFTEPVTYRGKVIMAIRIAPVLPEGLVVQPTDTVSDPPINWPD
jgi:hypothetical protein